ncbi:hypothetical protein [Spongiactinospora sp. 9N601]|uniref:hypothetical protein n=1 Tax=Spongiactinospora sp. 9N601 TaxID=3375149 RepID=UPI0037A60C37
MSRPPPPSRRPGGSPFHHGSHRHLLAAGRPAAPLGRVDALVVPTARRAAALRHAAGLARALAVPLVALCSRWASAAGAAKAADAAGAALLAIDVPEARSLALPALATTDLLADTKFERRTDVSAKRNLGLLIARMVGWRRIVFLDDDITVSDRGDLLRAARLLDVYDGVGLSIGGFPDNSVVCHAHRRTGGYQETFIGGGALAVDPVRTTSFFPDIYNDDWFYLLDDKRLRRVAVTGRAFQAPYDPFAHPDRARAEELGDVLAEGVYSLLDVGGTVRHADRGFWVGFLGRRRRFIDDVSRRVERCPDTPERRRMTLSLKAAHGRLQFITPDLCADYLHAWLADRTRWRRFARRLPTPVRLERALTLAGLEPREIVVRRARGGGYHKVCQSSSYLGVRDEWTPSGSLGHS